MVLSTVVIVTIRELAFDAVTTLSFEHEKVPQEEQLEPVAAVLRGNYDKLMRLSPCFN